MDLENAYIERNTTDNTFEDSATTNNLSAVSLFVEEHISLQDFDIHEFDQGEKYHLGIINISGNKVGFIADTFFNKKFVQNAGIIVGDTVIFDSQKVKFSEEDFQLQTVKNIYLVKYVLGEFVVNEKNGKEQRTINYDYPIEILKVYSRRTTAYISIQSNGVICKYKNEKSMQRAELNEQTKISIQIELAKSMGNSNMFFASLFPQLLKQVGVENYKEYADNIEEFVELYLTPQFCFCKNVEINGKIHPGVIFFLKGENTDEVLSDISSSRKPLSLKLDGDGKNKLQYELIKYMGNSLMLYASVLPKILKQVGLEDYKKYATTVEQFVETYLTPKFCFQRNLELNGKVYSNVVILLEGRDISEVLPDIISSEEKAPKNNTSLIVLPEELQSKVIEVLKMVATETGFVYASVIPGILETIGIYDWKQYASTIAQFCEKYTKNYFQFKAKVKIDGKFHSGVLFLKKELKKVDREEELLLYDTTLFDEYRDCEGVRFGIINVCSNKTGFINQEYVDKRVFPEYVLDGSQSTMFETLSVNFEPKTIKLKTIKYIYLVAYFVKGTVVNTKTGEEQPAFDYTQPVSIIKTFSRKDYARIKVEEKGILTERFKVDGVSNKEEKSNIKDEQGNYGVLHELYRNGDYYAFLSSAFFRRLVFCDMPRDIQIAALNCAAKLFSYEEDIEICLNGFQHELISNATPIDFIRKWKSGSSFNQDIVVECAETSIFSYELSRHSGYVIDCLNSIGYSNARNDNYPGLTRRFGLCYNQILPYLFFIRAVVQGSHPTTERCISEFIQIVKSVQQSDIYYLVKDKVQLYSIKKFFVAIDKYVCPLNELPRLLKTSIASVFVDVGQMEQYNEMIELLESTSMSVDRKLVSLYFDFEACTEQQIKDLLNENVSIQLLQKVISLVWERYCDLEVLPENMIRVLAWICMNDASTSVDEILRYHLVNKKFYKLQKIVQLMNSFEKICVMVDEDASIHVIASYIRFVICEDVYVDTFPERCLDIKAQWQVYTSKLYDAIIVRLGEVNCENENEYLKLFRVFRLDLPNQIKLQNTYSSWYIKEFRDKKNDVKEYEGTLDWLFANRAYKAYCDLIFEYWNNDNESSEKAIRQYVSSLMELQRYGDALDYLQQHADVEKSVRNELIIRVLAENFRNNGLSAAAFVAFSADFSIDDAIELLLKEYKPNQYHLITCMISLYCEKKDYLRVAYLYVIFQIKAESGYTRLYAQIRRKTSSFLGKLKNHYNVIEFSFSTLNPSEIIEFLKWTQMIAIPALKGYNPTHTFAFFYERLMNSPTDEKNWIDFYSHLAKRKDVNAWQIVVCESILEQEFNYKGDVNSSSAIRKVINTVHSEELPFNLLPYVFNYIVRNNDVILCEDLVRLLHNSDTYRKLIDESMWADNYKEASELFKVFCLQQFSESGNEVYYKLMTLLGVTYDIKELAVLTQTAGDKSYLYRVICNEYMGSTKTAEIIELLNNTEWNNMTSRDLAMLGLLRLLYRDEEFFLTNKLFASEADVYRFKSDCVKILSVYPDKAALFEFDKNCVNDQYKLLVYSYVFTVMYDEDIYHKYEYSYESLASNPGRFYSYMRFLITVFNAQLEWNREYPYFYKKWRYLKLYLASVLYADGIVNDCTIVESMEQNGHYENVYVDGYKPFVENVNKFLITEGIEEIDKRYILYSLMMGRMGDFLQMNGVKIRFYSLEERSLLRKMISQLDYREVNLSFYRIYWPKIKTGDFTEAKDIGAALSNYTRDTLSALQKLIHDKKLCELFESISLQEKPSYVTRGVFQLEGDTFLKYRDVLLPLLCSRQFLFLIYGSTRTLVVQRRAESGMMKYAAMTDYISKYRPNEAKAVKGYLVALDACLNNKREDALAILHNTDIETDIPTQWKREASNIRCYAEGKIKIFKPDSTIVDSSLENEHKTVKFWFVKKLQKAFNIERKRVDFETAASLYEKYLGQNVEFQERIKASADLVLNYPKLDKDQKKELQIPSKNALILSLGLDVVEKEYFFNATDRLSILFNLYSGRKMFKENGEDIKRLNDILGQSLKTNISLELWVKYRDIIKEFLDDNHMLMDFAMLQERILEKCAVLVQDGTSQEKKYIGFKQLLRMSEGLESVYSRNVFDAIRRVCRRIEDGSRLEITIVNEKCRITDGYVYFMIRNIGKGTVALSDEYMVLFKQDGHPEIQIDIDSIKDLQSSFITGGKARPILHGTEEVIFAYLAIYKKGHSDKPELLCDTNEKLNICETTNLLQVTRRNRYKVGTDSAVTDADMLFGRNEIQNLLQDMIPAGVTVMYGPSRIGKTSIMNWIRNTLAVNQGNVMSIIIGGEGGMGKESDYQESFVNSNLHLPVPYEDDEKMAEYLMVSTIIQSMTTMKRRLRLPLTKKVSDELFTKMIGILEDVDQNIADRYYYLNELLIEEDLELWLLLDEFQQVVEHWKPKASCEFVRVCKILLYDGENSNIKLIICGSDDLLRHMVLEDESIWRLTFPEYARVSVEPLKKEPFCDMIIKDKKITGTNLSYSESALDALFSYTGGVALYGKEIGNVLLDDMESNPIKYQGRNIVYVSDIAEATQRLLNRQASELDTKAKEGIREIYDAVTKNLKPDTDMQYLWYIAKWLKENPNYDSFSETVFTDHDGLRDEKGLHDSLEIAVARGILDCRESSIDGINKYVFRTIFYYFAFLGSAKNNLDERKIFIQEDYEKPEVVIEENALTMIRKFGELSDSDQMTVLSSVYHQKLNPEARENFRKGIGDQYGDVVQGSKIGTQNNIQVNIQDMTNALTNIISGQNAHEAYKKLPTLGTYIDSQLTEQQQQSLKNRYKELKNASLSDEQRLIVQDEIYELSRPVVDAIASDYVAAEMNAIMNGTYPLDDESATAEEEFYNSIGVSKDNLDELKQLLPGGIQIQFDFAVMLHKIFYQLKNEQNIDYCPVVILYCKMIEGLLKEKHFEIYIKKLSRGNFPKVRLGNHYFEWNYFIDRDGGIDKKKVKQNRKKLTLGSFSFPLGRISDVTDFGSDIIINRDVIEALATPIGTDDPNTKDLQLWNKHAEMLPWIREYRNRSAHELTPISNKDMDNICKILFNKKELDTILKLTKRQ